MPQMVCNFMCMQLMNANSQQATYSNNHYHTSEMTA